MPSDVSATSRIDRISPPSVSSAAAGGVASSRALVRVAPVAPVDPQRDTHLPGTPLGRSGLDLQSLLTTTDQMVARSVTGPVALDVGLEQARATLLRNLPGDALAALDQVWEGALHTEEGWYLRTGALLVMGLAAEADRIADDATLTQPHSVALRFVQSLARLAMGDVTGARTTLQMALQRMPNDPTLLALHALIVARQGDRDGAAAVLRRMQQAEPEHPAIDWARSAIRTTNAESTRQQSRITPSRVIVTTPFAAATFTPELIDPALPVEIPEAPHVTAAGDPVTSALEQFGASLTGSTATDAVREARALLKAFSTGGTLAPLVTADVCHGMRMLCTALLVEMSGTAPIRYSPVQTLLGQLVPLLRQGRASDAEALVRRNSAHLREPTSHLLMTILRGASQALENMKVADVASVAGHADIRGASEPWEVRRSLRPTPAAPTVVHEEVDRGPVVPIRLGLALLDESAALRSRPMPNSTTWMASIPHGVLFDGLSTVRGPDGQVAATAGFEQNGRGWGAAAAAAVSQPTVLASVLASEGVGMRFVALVCVVMAAILVMSGHVAVALGLAVGAAWLGLRRRGSDHPDMAETRQHTMRVKILQAEPGIAPAEPHGLPTHH